MLYATESPDAGHRVRPRAFEVAAPLAAALPLRGLVNALLHALDELDYGLVLVDGEGRVEYLNHAARVCLASDAALRLETGHLRARLPGDAAPLSNAIREASALGRRRLLGIGSEGLCTSVSVVPLAADDLAHARLVLIILGKSTLCESLSIQSFARLHGLTAAEAKVLVELVRGETPASIAQRFGVSLSTVRTQIGSMRSKTGASGIREVVRQVAVLPPLRTSLRHQAA